MLKGPFIGRLASEPPPASRTWLTGGLQPLL